MDILSLDFYRERKLLNKSIYFFLLTWAFSCTHKPRFQTKELGPDIFAVTYGSSQVGQKASCDIIHKSGTYRTLNKNACRNHYLEKIRRYGEQDLCKGRTVHKVESCERLFSQGTRVNGSFEEEIYEIFEGFHCNVACTSKLAMQVEKVKKIALERKRDRDHINFLKSSCKLGPRSRDESCIELFELLRFHESEWQYPLTIGCLNNQIGMLCAELMLRAANSEVLRKRMNDYDLTPLTKELLEMECLAGIEKSCSYIGVLAKACPANSRLCKAIKLSAFQIENSQTEAMAAERKQKQELAVAEEQRLAQAEQEENTRIAGLWLQFFEDVSDAFSRKPSVTCTTRHSGDNLSTTKCR